MSALNSLSAQYTDSEGEETAPAASSSPAGPPSNGDRVTVSQYSGGGDSRDRSGSPQAPHSGSQSPSSSNSTVRDGERAINKGLVSYLGDDDDAAGDNSDASSDQSGASAGQSDMEISQSEAEHDESRPQRVRKRQSRHNGSSAATQQRRHDARQPATPSEAGSDDGILPPEPPGSCSRELQERIANLVRDQRRTGADMNQEFKNRKDFRNPSIYQKLIVYCNINEFDTNYPPELYDPTIWGEQSFYEELAKVQKEDMERREKERKERTKVEVVTVTKRVDSSSSSLSTSADKQNKRSKWDVIGAGAANTGALGISVPPPALAHPLPSVAPSAATAAAAKTIPAFGNIGRRR